MQDERCSLFESKATERNVRCHHYDYIEDVELVLQPRLPGISYKVHLVAKETKGELS